jgi:hypothetical protein
MLAYGKRLDLLDCIAATAPITVKLEIPPETFPPKSGRESVAFEDSAKISSSLAPLSSIRARACS